MSRDDIVVHIYTLSDPETGEVRYVGKTSNPRKRLSQHIEKKKGTSYTKSWIKSLKNRGLKPNMTTIEKCNIYNWEDREKFWISTFRYMGAKLTNLTQGGEGAFGLQPSQETREKMSASAKSRPANRKGQINSESHRANISAAKKGKRVNHLLRPEAIEKSAAAKRGKPRDEETRKKLSEANKGKKQTLEQQDKKRRSMLAINARKMFDEEIKTYSVFI